MGPVMGGDSPGEGWSHGGKWMDTPWEGLSGAHSSGEPPRLGGGRQYKVHSDANHH